MKNLPLALLAIATVGCSTWKATINSYTDPAYKAGDLKKIAVFPIRNAKFAPADAQELDRKVVLEVRRRNTIIEMLGPSEAVKAINDKGLANEWAVFLGNYVSSGIPDANFLKQIGKALGVDSILQGEIVRVHAEDGDGWMRHGNTRVTVRYTMLSTATGKMLWEASSDGIRRNAGASGEAPPIIEAVDLAITKILEVLPL